MTITKTEDIIIAIQKHKEAIAQHRDSLQDILNDLEAIVDATGNAVEELEVAIETLSQYT